MSGADVGPDVGFKPCHKCPHGAAHRGARKSWAKGPAYLKAKYPEHEYGRSEAGYAARIRAEKAQRIRDLENLEC